METEIQTVSRNVTCDLSKCTLTESYSDSYKADVSFNSPSISDVTSSSWNDIISNRYNEAFEIEEATRKCFERMLSIKKIRLTGLDYATTTDSSDLSENSLQIASNQKHFFETIKIYFYLMVILNFLCCSNY